MGPGIVLAGTAALLAGSRILQWGPMHVGVGPAANVCGKEDTIVQGGICEGLDLTNIFSYERAVFFTANRSRVLLFSGREASWYLGLGDHGRGLVLSSAPVIDESERVLLPPGSIVELDVAVFLSAPTSLDENIACASIESALTRRAGNVVPFTLTSAYGSGARLLKFWLEYCKIDNAALVQLWPATLEGRERGASPPCDVISVEGLVVAENTPLDCLEDVLASFHLEFVSPLGLGSWPLDDVNGIEREQQQRLRELVRVLGAFANVAPGGNTHLVVTSMMGSALYHHDSIRLLESSLRLAILDAFYPHSSDHPSGQKLRALLSSLESPFQASFALRCLLQSLREFIIEEDEEEEEEEDRRRRLAIVSLAISAGQDQAHWVDINLVTALSNIGSENEEERRKLPLLPPTSQHEPPLISVSVGATWVLVFVLQAHQLRAQQVVDGMKKSCETKVCHMYVFFWVVAVPAEKGQSRPSIRLALMQAAEIVGTMALPRDLVTILIGIDSLMSFPGVSSSESDNGFIPLLAYGTDGVYRLPAPMVVASTGVSNDIWQPRAFACTMPLFHLLLQESAESSPAQSNDADIVALMLRFFRLRSNQDVWLDKTQQFFNFSTVEGNVEVEMEMEMEMSKVGLVMLSSPNAVLIADKLGQCGASSSAAINVLKELASTHAVQDTVVLATLLMRHASFCGGGGGGDDWLPTARTLSSRVFGDLTRTVTHVAQYVPLLDLVRSARHAMMQLDDGPQFDHPELAAFSAGIFAALGEWDAMAAAFSASLSAEVDDFPVVHAQRDLWTQQRGELTTRVHFLTVASNLTDNVRMLQLSAALSGVHLVTLGLGEPWGGYCDKIKWYLSWLSSSSVTDDNDVVVLLDAYDVLLFPAVAQIGARFKETSATPIVFCAENGVYPEAASALFYRRGGGARVARFLNSGCIVGRVDQVREMLQEVLARSDVFADDQQLYTRYALAHPGLVSIDVDRSLFVTTHKYSGPEINVDLDFSSAFGVVHCNNLASNYAQHYGRLAAQINFLHDTFYRGPDGADLLRVVSGAFGQGAQDKSRALLQSQLIQANSTSNGGTNCLSDYLLHKWGTRTGRSGAAQCSLIAERIKVVVFV